MQTRFSYTSLLQKRDFSQPSGSNNSFVWKALLVVFKYQHWPISFSCLADKYCKQDFYFNSNENPEHRQA